MPADNSDHESRMQADISAERETDHAPPERPDIGAPSTIVPGLPVISADGQLVGIVAALEGDRIRLRETTEDGSATYVPASMIDGVGTAGVQLCSRGDATFGEGAQP